MKKSVLDKTITFSKSNRRTGLSSFCLSFCVSYFAMLYSLYSLEIYSVENGVILNCIYIYRQSYFLHKYGIVHHIISSIYDIMKKDKNVHMLSFYNIFKEVKYFIPAVVTIFILLIFF